MAIDGVEIADESTLGRLLQERGPGDRVGLRVIRQNRTLSVRVQLGEKPATQY